jgi:hypothetical protein
LAAVGKKAIFAAGKIPPLARQVKWGMVKLNKYRNASKN